MPKLTYHQINGRACMIRLLLKHAGKEFVDQYPGVDGLPAWPEMKAANPERGGLPWYEDDNGKVFNQSTAILKALANEVGYKSSDPWTQYKSDWVLEVFLDYREKPDFWKPFFKPDCTQEEKDACKALVSKMFDVLEE